MTKKKNSPINDKPTVARSLRTLTHADLGRVVGGDGAIRVHYSKNYENAF